MPYTSIAPMAQVTSLEQTLDLIREKAIKHIPAGETEPWGDRWLIELIKAYNARYSKDTTEEYKNRSSQFKRIFDTGRCMPDMLFQLTAVMKLTIKIE